MALTVSVIIPAYNAARFIGDAIQSVLRQTTRVCEIIVVDDGSSDDTKNVVERYSNTVKYIYQPNTGVSAARNRGIQAAGCDVLAFLDADDTWLPDKIEKQLEAFVRNERIGIVATDRSDIDASGNILQKSLFKRQGMYEWLVDMAGHEIPQALKHLVHTNFLPTSSVMVLKRALDDVGGFDTTIRYGEDLELWARIVARYSLVCLPEALVLYRLHDSNATQHTERLLVDMVRVMERIRSWGREALLEQGVNPDEVVSQAQWELGYWYFDMGHPASARKSLWASFLERPRIRALAYIFLCYLPPQAMKAARNVKHWLRTNK